MLVNSVKLPEFSFSWESLMHWSIMSGNRLFLHCLEGMQTSHFWDTRLVYTAAMDLGRVLSVWLWQESILTAKLCLRLTLSAAHPDPTPFWCKFIAPLLLWVKTIRLLDLVSETICAIFNLAYRSWPHYLSERVFDDAFQIQKLTTAVFADRPDSGAYTEVGLMYVKAMSISIIS